MDREDLELCSPEKNKMWFNPLSARLEMQRRMEAAEKLMDMLASLEPQLRARESGFLMSMLKNRCSGQWFVTIKQLRYLASIAQKYVEDVIWIGGDEMEMALPDNTIISLKEERFLEDD